MTPKALGRIAIALVAVLVLWGASRLLSRRSDSVVGGWSIPNVSAGDVDSVRVDRPGTGSALLVHRQGSWTVNGWPADHLAVDALFKALHDSSRAELVGESKAVHERLSVDSAGGTRMRVYGKGRAAIDLTVGKSGDSYPSAYARRTGEMLTYMLHSEMGDVAHRATDDWRDKRIVGVPIDSITGFDVDLGRKSYAVAQPAGKKWQFAGGKPADSARVMAQLAHYTNILATGFATRAQIDSMTKRTPARHLVVRNGNHTMTEMWFDSTANGFLVKRARDSVVYKMESWAVNDLTPTDSTLRPAPAPPAMPQVLPPPPRKTPAKTPSKAKSPTKH
jgi:hypothetical protein